VDETTLTELSRLTAKARDAGSRLADTPPRDRSEWLHRIADALERHRDDLVSLADSETALGQSRLTSEVDRAAAQLRFYGNVAVEGSYLRATIDLATGTTPFLARVQRPLGPVAVFGASNFPFAFGVLGNDTASAIAAGCPVLAKAHPAHPLLSALLASLAEDALRLTGAPVGTFGIASGFEAGLELVKSSTVQAVAFTGSQAGGLALWRAANDRDVVIPVFAEMSTVNPVVVTRAALSRLAEVAAGFVGSFTQGSGQFCTKPGLLFAPQGQGVAHAVVKALKQAAPDPVMLTQSIAAAYSAGFDELAACGATVVGTSPASSSAWAVPAAILEAPIDQVRPGSRLLEECFGPIAIVVEYADIEQLQSVLAGLQGALAASVITAEGAEAAHDNEVTPLVRLLAAKVGRVAINEWPTGVAVAWAQQHGGPWPATSAPATTSVGAAALDRFTRPVAYQSVPDRWLPPPLREQNPWAVPRRIDGVLRLAGAR
jgi:NADP-dependent aldehyde dehydrogenase